MADEGGESVAPRQAESVIRGLGVSLRPIRSYDAAMVTDRDFGGSYNQIHTGGIFYPHGLQRTGLFIGDHLVGFSYAGLVEEEGRKVGEVSIAHVSPPVRDLGLVSLLTSRARKWLVETGTDVLRSTVNDRTGKIVHLLEKQGFTPTGRKKWWGDEVYERTIQSPADRTALLELLDGEIERKIEALGQHSDLVARAQRVERDNPHEVDIEALVTDRLNTLNILDKQAGHINIFEYPGAEAHLLSYFSPDESSDKPLLPEEREKQIGKYGITFHIGRAQRESVSELLQAQGLASYRVIDKREEVEEPITGSSIYSPKTENPLALKDSVRQLAHVASLYYAQ
jgi:hypothetical protein